MTDRCEPPEHLRGVDGWHQVETADGRAWACWLWRTASQGWDHGGYPIGYRYGGPAPEAKESEG